MRRIGVFTVILSLALLPLAPSAGAAAPSCDITWGSLSKQSAGFPSDLSGSQLTNVRGGRHACYDRLVVDLNGPVTGYRVQYRSQVRQQGTGDPLPLRGGATLEILVNASAHDGAGNATYAVANADELVPVAGWRTFRQVAWGGSFESQTTIGLGVRARLPFRVFTVAGPGSGSRLVIDVGHRW